MVISIRNTPSDVSFTAQLMRSECHSETSWHRELEIVKALRIAHDDENKEEEAIALERLGDVYNARANLVVHSKTLFARLDHFVLATALYNSSLIRNNDSSKKNDLETKIRQIEEDLISQCNQAIDNTQFKYDIDRKHKNHLYDFRKQCSEKLEYIQSKYIVFTSPLHDTDSESEARRANEIKELFSEIRVFMKDAVASLLDECMEVLGQPPENVTYAFIGFGSFARGEATPFSDLEFALLIEEGQNNASTKEYFVKVMEYFNYKVLNVQETILPSMCIPSLNDDNLLHSLERYKCSSSSCNSPECKFDAAEWPFLGKGKEFYDNEMRGFSVDGRMSSACKTPLGRLVRGQNEDLIKTPTELAQLYVSALKTEHSGGEQNHALSTILSNVSFLYGNDQELVDNYHALVLSMADLIAENTNFNHRQSSALLCLQDAFDVFHFSLTSRDIGLISSIKKKLYRAVGMLITNIGKFQYSTVTDNSPWVILDLLLDDGIISADAHRNLYVIVGIVNELRLMAYLRNGRQDEIFSFFDQSTDINLELTRDLCIRFFYTVFPFQRTVKKIILKLNANESTVIQFQPNEKFYEYSHFNSAIALSFTSYRYFNAMTEKFAQAYDSTENEDLKRLCLAYLSCCHPDYSTKYCENILTSIGETDNCEWKIFTYLIAAMASFHQDNIGNIEIFLNAVNEAIKNDIFAALNSTTKVTVRAYNMLISGFLKFRQRSYEEALTECDSARSTYETIMKSKGSVVSLFEIATLFMSGSCHMMLGRNNDFNIELAMCKARNYTGNGDYMRILYHTYMLFQKGADDQLEIIRQIERILELFMRFRCPQGQEIWASILGQGIILAALFLGLLYRNMEKVDDALRIFRLASSCLKTKALALCGDKYHVGKIKAEKTRMFIDAFTAIFKFSEAECLHLKGLQDEMWTCIDGALVKLAEYRGQFEQIEQRDVFAEAVSLERFNLRGCGSFPVDHTNENRQHSAPRFVDTLGMAPLLESWCDTLTRELQFVLYTTERDVIQQILQQATPIVSIVVPNLLPQLLANPCQILRDWIPVIRPAVDEIIKKIFLGFNTQRAVAFEFISRQLGECQQYAVEFLDYWKELFFLFLRFSLCNDLLNSFGFLKE